MEEETLLDHINEVLFKHVKTLATLDVTLAFEISYTG